MEMPFIQYKEHISKYIKGVVRELSPDHATPLMLYHFEDMSYEEIADLMKTPVNTIKSRIFRGREQLKIKLRQMSNLDNILF